MKSKHLAASALVLFLARDAYGDEPSCPDPGCHVKSESTLTTVKGSVLKLPPGYFLDEPTWTKRDAELKAAQDAATRLKAENESFRKSTHTFPWPAVISATITAFGALALHYL